MRKRLHISPAVWPSNYKGFSLSMKGATCVAVAGSKIKQLNLYHGVNSMSLWLSCDKETLNQKYIRHFRTWKGSLRGLFLIVIKIFPHSYLVQVHGNSRELWAHPGKKDPLPKVKPLSCSNVLLTSKAHWRLMSSHGSASADWVDFFSFSRQYGHHCFKKAEGYKW